jgi:hypothetical protein
MKTYIKQMKNKSAAKIAAAFVIVFIISIYIFGYNHYNEISAVAVYRPELVPTGCTCPSDHNLPVIVINTNNNNIDEVPDKITTETILGESDIYEESALHIINISIYEPGEYGFTCTCGAIPPAFTDTAAISIRGQSTLKIDKHQFTVAFTDPDGTDKNVSLLGMPEGDKWVLNGSYYDRSLIRNALALDTARQIMDWAPRYEFCELLVSDSADFTFDGNYRGVYLLEEKVDRSVNRINIERADPRYEDVSFIISRDKVKNDDYIFDSDWSTMNDLYIIGGDGRIRTRSMLVSNYPNVNVTDEYRARIKEYIDGFEYALNSKYFDDTNTGYRRFIDIDSFVGNAAVNEVFANTDGGGVSTYFYKSLSGKMSAGPIWDFDSTLNNIPTGENDTPYGINIIGTSWYSRLFQDRYFSDVFVYFYRTHREDVFDIDNLYNRIDGLTAELGPAAVRNSEYWYGYDRRGDAVYWLGRNNPFDYEAEIEDIKSFLAERLEWLDRNINLVYRIQENAE